MNRSCEFVYQLTQQWPAEPSGGTRRHCDNPHTIYAGNYYDRNRSFCLSSWIRFGIFPTVSKTDNTKRAAFRGAQETEEAVAGRILAAVGAGTSGEVNMDTITRADAILSRWEDAVSALAEQYLTPADWEEVNPQGFATYAQVCEVFEEVEFGAMLGLISQEEAAERVITVESQVDEIVNHARNIDA